LAIQLLPVLLSSYYLANLKSKWKLRNKSRQYRRERVLKHRPQFKFIVSNLHREVVRPLITANLEAWERIVVHFQIVCLSEVICDRLLNSSGRFKAVDLKKKYIKINANIEKFDPCISELGRQGCSLQHIEEKE
jgi:hypothetical protein